MIRRALVALLFVPTLALAQMGPATPSGTPIQLSPTPGGPPITFEMPGMPKGPLRYLTEDVASVRFLGEQVPGPALSAGDAVEVVYEEAGWTRVKKGDTYGWVPSTKLTETAPTPAAPAAPALPPIE